jgi:hypothetical protein
LTWSLIQYNIILNTNWHLLELGRYENAQYVFFSHHSLLSVNIQFWMYIFKWIFDYKFPSATSVIISFKAATKNLFQWLINQCFILAWAINLKHHILLELNPFSVVTNSELFDLFISWYSFSQSFIIFFCFRFKVSSCWFEVK